MSHLSPAEIFVAAETAAIAAAAAEHAKLPPEQQRGFDCGFGWAVVKPARGPFINWCRANGKGYKKDYGGGGWCFWSPAHAHYTQSVSVHYAGAVAFAEVLTANGLNAYADQRLD